MEERLPRHLGLWSAAAVLVGTTIGSGIFRVPREVAAALGDPKAMLLIWVVGGIVTLTGALTIAEKSPPMESPPIAALPTGAP